MTDAHDVIARQLTRSGEIFLLAMEPLDTGEFFAGNPDGFPAAWVTGHLACVADLFSSWFPGCRLLLGEDFHAIFNETAAVPGRPLSAAEIRARAEEAQREHESWMAQYRQDQESWREQEDRRHASWLHRIDQQVGRMRADTTRLKQKYEHERAMREFNWRMDDRTRAFKA